MAEILGYSLHDRAVSLYSQVNVLRLHAGCRLFPKDFPFFLGPAQGAEMRIYLHHNGGTDVMDDVEGPRMQ